MIKGYKCFNKGLTNRYGYQFEVGVLYHADGDIKFGNLGNGFHMCKNLENTLRYFDAMNDEVDICEVVGFGDFQEYEDNYYGYYEMYSTEYIVINKVLTREEIFNHMLGENIDSLKRFISLYRLDEREKNIIREKYSKKREILNAISYYQDNDKEVYRRNI